jgi:hypothetical protein
MNHRFVKEKVVVVVVVAGYFVFDLCSSVCTESW